MVKKERKKRRVRKRILTAVLVIAAIIAICAVLMIKVFTVEQVEVDGNEIYSDEKIETWVLNDEYSWNSLYVYFKYKLKDMEEIPFVDSMEVSIKSPHVLHVEVYEKGLLGYVYIPALGQNAYIDKDGFVVELSSELIPGTTKISGLKVQDAVLYEKLSLERSSILKTLLNVSQLAKKYELEPDFIHVTKTGDVMLCYGDIQVNVGGNVYLNEKIVRLQAIMPQLEGMSGTLHLEDWTENNTDVLFSKGELTTIPNDVQTVPDSNVETVPDKDVETESDVKVEETPDENTQVEDDSDAETSENQDSEL